MKSKHESRSIASANDSESGFELYGLNTLVLCGARLYAQSSKSRFAHMSLSARQLETFDTAKIIARLAMPFAPHSTKSKYLGPNRDVKSSI